MLPAAFNAKNRGVPNQIRLLLDPKSPAGEAPEPQIFADLSLRLRAFGSGASQAKKASAQPAKIEFFTRFVDSARQTQSGPGDSLGAIQGQLSFQNGAPVFACDPTNLKQLDDAFLKAVDDTKDANPRSHRALGVHFEAPDFVGFDPDAGPTRLLLPPDDPKHSHLEVLAELSVAGQVEAARETNDVLDVPLTQRPSFSLPRQKQAAIADIGDDSGPILLASNDPSFLPGKGSVRDKIKAQNAKRGQDASPSTNPGGNFIPFFMIGKATRPSFVLDHGFLDDGNGNIDESKRQSPTLADFKQLALWRLRLNLAELVRPDLVDATNMYRHFLAATGTDFQFSYERFVKQDRTGAHILQNLIEDVRAAAIELSDPRGGNQFTIQCDAIPVGAFDDQGNLINPRYGYPGTENWQKAIGAHVVWAEANVTTSVDGKTKTPAFSIKMTLHAEDRYNFNPGNQDIASGILDQENGRFEIVGLGKEFTSIATLTRTVSFSLPSGPLDLRAVPPSQIISPPNREPIAPPPD